MIPYDILGLVAGAFGSASLVLQVVRSFRLRETYELSLPFLLLYISAVILWLWYGIGVNAFPVIFWHVVVGILTGMLLFAKLRWGMRRPSDKKTPD